MTLQICEAHQSMCLGSMKTQTLKSIISAELSQEIALYYSAPSVSPETPPAYSKMELPCTAMPSLGQAAMQPALRKKSQRLSANSRKHNRGLKRICAVHTSANAKVWALGFAR